jgi:hypothetical protein
MNDFFNGLIVVSFVLIGMAFLSMFIRLFVNADWKLHLGDAFMVCIGGALVIGGIGLIGDVMTGYRDDRMMMSFGLGTFAILYGANLLRQLYQFRHADRAWKKYLNGDKAEWEKIVEEEKKRKK